jgi:hypothetical protein
MIHYHPYIYLIKGKNIICSIIDGQTARPGPTLIGHDPLDSASESCRAIWAHMPR